MDGATLIVGELGIGDMVMSHCLVQTLKEREPDIPIDVIATERNAPIPLLFPEVRKVLVRPERASAGYTIDGRMLTYLKRMPLRAFFFPRIIRQIKRGNYSKAYILRFNHKDAWGPYFAGVPERIGRLSTKISDMLQTESYVEPVPRQHASRSMAMLGHPEGSSFEAPPPSFSVPTDVPVPLPNDLLELAESGRLIAFCPGGTREDKKWPAVSFGKLTAPLLERDFQIIILGAPADQTMAQQIVELSPAGSVHDLTGRFELMETLSILSRCHALVSNDTGLMHAAAALGIITLGVFMSTDPAIWRPLGPAAHYVSTYVDDREAARQHPSTDQVIATLEGLL